MNGRIGSQRLGEVLIQNGIITETQLEKALSFAKENRDKLMLLGEALVSLGYCSEVDIARTMAHKSKAKFVNLNDIQINIQASNLVSPELAAKYNALPVDFTEDNEKLIVAMQNPTDLMAIDDLSLLTGYEIEPVVVEDSQLKSAIEHFDYMSNNINVYDEDEEEVQVKDDEENLTLARPAVQLVNQMLNQAIKAKASDVHVEPGEKRLKIRYRIDGVLHDIMQQSPKMAPSIASRFKVLGNMDIAERRIPQDGRMTFKSQGIIADIRIATLPTVFGEKITLRIVDRNSKLLTLDKLGMPEKQRNGFYKAISFPYGFILITGPTGSGKSTTLYAALSRLNSPDKNIITLEDPVERRIEGLNQIQINERAGLLFSSGLRSILRSDPDIVMVGEIRDKETAKIAVESALTGHLVLSTLHTNNSAGALTRLGEMGVEPYLTASSLIGVVAQRLVRVLCKECKEEYNISRSELLNILPDFPIEPNEDETKIYKATGCVQCNNTGYSGRMGIYEFLEVTEDIQNLILGKVSTIDIENRAVENGMVTLRADGLNKIKEGYISIEEFLRVIV
ncbi:MAG TPA: ATPase, T2SS/T4P/T4SS family [Clostridia bacterium]|nr:ATPase, T2SS/T4P/T4SS family [Clostridia bacterium]HPQ46315.1 ATPase, T2SS/T4P/T4SS family [Clostridia bacterium]HRX41596.1 ATPase, T2SS/T4P/T4SS family [Clostridia bacterium]